MPDKNDSNKSKNIVEGDIKNVKGGIRIGDESHTHIHAETAPPSVLTAKLPTTHLSEIIGRDEDLADVKKRLFEHQQVLLVNGIGKFM